MSLHPIVTNDPRFRAGCKLVKTGKAHCGAIDLFAALVEETRCRFGETSLNSAASYYEYGHALFRGACRRGEVSVGGNDEEDANDDLDKKPQAFKGVGGSDSGSRVVSKSMMGDSTGKGKPGKLSQVTEGNEGSGPQQEREDKNEVENDKEDDDDVKLALELMENSWAILDDYVQSHNNEDYVPVKIDQEKITEDPSPSSPSVKNTKMNVDDNKASKMYLNWARDQQPRILLGIGDVFDFQNKYGDAVDAYTRAIPLRERLIPDQKLSPSIELLKRRRQLVEVLVLVAETLLKCPGGSDVATSESDLLIVKDTERVDFARGYYDKAKEELQETVFLMGKLASQKKDITTEKEDICFIATMLMGVGTTLAEMDEEQAEELDGSCAMKKQKLV